MADGLFYVDSRSPWLAADAPSVTITPVSTNVALLPIASHPVFGSNYWWVGKAVRIRLFGRATTAASVGTQTFNLLWGTAAGTTTVICATAAMALIASQTNMSFEIEYFVRCRAVGGAGVGSLFGWGMFNCNIALLASTSQPQMIPPTAPAATTVDLTVAGMLIPQVQATTSTTNTVQIHDAIFEAMN